MARITVEDCLKQVDNRFNLIHMAAKRVRLLRKGDEPLVASKNTDVVVALREIAAGKVFQSENDRDMKLLVDDKGPLGADALPEQDAEASSSEEKVDKGGEAAEE